MSGVERLRTLADAWGLWAHDGALAEMADQVERERACDADTIENIRLIVGGVVDEMERHILGHEGMEESPVASWARELREALGGDGRDPAADVSVSAYDLLPADEREAVAWVREHGGLEKVKLDAACWNTAENIAQTTLDWLARVCSVAGIEKCGYGIALERLEDAISSRLMPEGMEWPRYDTEELVDLGCEVARDDGMPALVDKVVFTGGRWQLFDRYGCEINGEPMGPGERLTRPVRAISAEGEEIRADSDVWWICEGDERGVHAERLHVESIGPTGLAECSPYNGGTWVHLEPSELYANKPVPASDGKPLRDGETVWDTNGDELVIVALEDGGHTVTCRYVDVGDAIPVHGMWSPSQLTHERPVADTWERLEEDATMPPWDYCEGHGLFEADSAYKELPTNERMARDLVRRAKRLAERGE